MTTRKDRKELTQSLRQMKSEDLEDVVKAQQHVIGITMGQHPFEHPGGPYLQPGTRYMPNETEVEFTQKSRTVLYSNFFRAMFIGAFAPYFSLRVLANIQRRVIQPQRYVLWSAVGGSFGGMYGMTLGRIAVARDYLRLENSPLATEARYQLFKLNPQHPFLQGFEHETHDWHEFAYRDPRDTYSGRGAPYDGSDDYYEDYDQQSLPPQAQKPKRPPPPYRPPPPAQRPSADSPAPRRPSRGRDTDRMDYRDRYEQQRGGVDDEKLRKRKRERFYQQKSRIDQNRLDDFDESFGGEEDPGQFFDPSSNLGSTVNPNDDIGEFFEDSNKQKWD
mmetsp:Transcript_44248/g.70874  ORF Transcript_44248/g.70874 Transcript_44248/m.70874 type:complete len:332 (+) Transcript_44248:172-1167(+)